MTQSPRLAAYGAAVFLTSAGGLILEIGAGRLLAPYVGMSLYSWTAIIAVVLGGFSVGHWVGGLLAGPRCDANTGARRVAYALAFAAASSFATLVLLRWIAGPLLSSGLPILSAIIALAGLVFFLPSLFVGIVSPILTKLALDAAPDQSGRVIGRMYALGAVGSIAGTLAAGYLFISWIGSTGTVLTVAGTYAVLAVLFAIPGRIAGTTAALLAILIAGLGFASLRADALTSPCTVESDYYCIRVDDFTRQSGRPSAVLVLDHLAHGINDRDDPKFLHSGYLQFLDAYVQQRYPLDTALEVMLIGGGALTFPRALVAERPDTRVVVAEIDPAVTRIAGDRLWVQADPRIGVSHNDARLVLQDFPPVPRFHLVLSDVFQDIAMPAHLVTREFNQQLRQRLLADGIYAINVIEGGREPAFLRSFVRTLAADFPSVEVWTELGSGDSRRTTYVVLAAFRASVPDRIATPGGPWQRLPFNSVFDDPSVPILTDDFAPVDRLLAHILLDPELGEH
jgi:MFS family permease